MLQKLTDDMSIESVIPALILEYRQLAKLVSTYLVALKEEINEKTGRIHASFNQTVAATAAVLGKAVQAKVLVLAKAASNRLQEQYAEFARSLDTQQTSAGIVMVRSPRVASLVDSSRLRHFDNTGRGNF